MNFIAVGPYCWGKGLTPDEAIRNARANWPRAHPVKRPIGKHFSLFSSEGTFAVDGIGNITSTQTIQRIQTSCLATQSE